MTKLSATGKSPSTIWFSLCPSTASSAFCRTVQKPCPYATRSATSKPLPSPAFTSGSIARSPTSTTPSCSTELFSGCSTSRGCWRTRGGANAETSGSYIELVVSASKSLIDKSRTEIVDLALKEVREFFPAARAANLVKSTVIKEVHATYSPRPGIDNFRPSQVTAWPRVFLAGDWSATGWPATMEGSVIPKSRRTSAGRGISRIATARPSLVLHPNKRVTEKR